MTSLMIVWKISGGQLNKTGRRFVCAKISAPSQFIYLADPEYTGHRNEKMLPMKLININTLNTLCNLCSYAVDDVYVKLWDEAVHENSNKADKS